MRPPPGLDPSARRAWHAAVAVLESMAEAPDRSPHVLREYAVAVSVADELRRRWEAEGRPTTSTGSKDQVVGHPLLTELRAQQTHVAALAARLGLDPAGRVAMGRRQGGAGPNARSPDKQRRLRPAKVISLEEAIGGDRAGGREGA